jgi:hypothetical protein
MSQAFTMQILRSKRKRGENKEILADENCGEKLNAQTIQYKRMASARILSRLL